MKAEIVIAAVLVLSACSPDLPDQRKADPDGYYVTQVRSAIGDTTPYTYSDAMLLNAGYAECAPGESNEAHGILAAAFLNLLSPEARASLTQALEAPDGVEMVRQMDLLEYDGALPRYGEMHGAVLKAVLAEANVLCPDANLPEEVADGRLSAILA